MVSQENGNTTESNREYENENWVQLSVQDSQGKLVVEEVLEVSLWRLTVRLEDLFTLRLFQFCCQDTTNADWES
jgi:hypothetical protein